MILITMFQVEAWNVRSFWTSLHRKKGGGNDKPYPLSITSAATSSVDEEDDQRSSLLQISCN